MKQVIILFFVLFVSACFQEEPPKAKDSNALDAKRMVTGGNIDKPLSEESVRAESAAKLYAQKARDVAISDIGTVVKILKDDNKGARHQKFLVIVSDSITLLFAHNIDLAPRISDIAIGDKVEFHGEYVYNPKGGVVHWTHKDPNGGHRGGYILHRGIVYQ